MSLKEWIIRPFRRIQEMANSINEETFLLAINIGALGATISLISCIVSKNYESLPSNIATTVACVLTSALCRKPQRVKWVMRTFMILLSIVILPYMYITGGGIQSGIFLWFALAFCYSLIALDLKTGIVVGAIQLAIDIGVCLYGYKYPLKIQGKLNRHDYYMDTIVAFVLVSVILAIIINYFIYRMEKANEALVKAKREAEIATQSKSMFLASMSHEIRTPLNAILNLNEEILSTDDVSEMKENAADVKYSAEVLSKIINDVLDFSKIEQGKFVLSEEIYETKGLISHLHMFSAQASAKNVGFTIEESKENPLPEGLFGDDVRIKQIAANLVSNAIKYTTEGDVRVDLSYVKDNKSIGNGYLKIVVKDNGIGIKEEDKSHIFEAFERVDLRNTNHIQGTGLGLAITKSFVELLKGEITVDSVVNEGSTFIVTIPQSIAKIERIEDDEEENFDFSDLKILVCDDNALNLKVAKKLFAPTNANVVLVDSGEAALEALKDEEFDLIYLDYQMPEMDGKECMQAIKEQGIDIPVIVLTADASDNPSLRYSNMGFDDYVAKPIEKLDLFRMTKKYGYIMK